MISKERKKGRVLSDIRMNWASYILLMPAVIYTFIFGYATLPYLVIVFQKYSVTDGLFNGKWIGLKNFEAFFSSPRWIEVTINTITINFFSIIFTTLIAVILSILLNEIKNKAFIKTTQSTFLFPHFLSWVVVSYMIYALFASDVGLINQVLESLGLEKIKWYSTPEPWTWILVWMRVWKGLGFNIVIFLSAITGIDTSIYEASIIDGASRWQKIRYITVPLLFPSVSIVLLFAIGKIFYGDFGMIYSIIRDNAILYPRTDVIDTYVFRLLRKTGDPAHSMAVGVYQSLLGFLMVYVTNFIAKKLDEDSALF